MLIIVRQFVFYFADRLVFHCGSRRLCYYCCCDGIKLMWWATRGFRCTLDVGICHTVLKATDCGAPHQLFSLCGTGTRYLPISLKKKKKKFFGGLHKGPKMRLLRVTTWKWIKRCFTSFQTVLHCYTLQSRV